MSEYICPKCNEITTNNKTISEYIDMIYINLKCSKCSFEWRRAFHYIGNSLPCRELDGFSQQAEVIYLLKRAIHNLKVKIVEAQEYKSYDRLQYQLKIKEMEGEK